MPAGRHSFHPSTQLEISTFFKTPPDSAEMLPPQPETLSSHPSGPAEQATQTWPAGGEADELVRHGHPTEAPADSVRLSPAGRGSILYASSDHQTRSSRAGSSDCLEIPGETVVCHETPRTRPFRGSLWPGHGRKPDREKRKAGADGVKRGRYSSQYPLFRSASTVRFQHPLLPKSHEKAISHQLTWECSDISKGIFHGKTRRFPCSSR